MMGLHIVLGSAHDQGLSLDLPNHESFPVNLGMIWALPPL